MADDVIIYAAGAIPGVPGEIAPGVYTIDSDARTATFVAPLPDTQDPTQDPNQTDMTSTDASAQVANDTPPDNTQPATQSTSSN